VNELVGLLVGLTAVLAFLGTGTVFVLSGRQKVRLSALEASNDDLRNDVGDRDRRITFLESENAAKTKEIVALHLQVEALEKLKTGEAYFAAMHDQMEAHTAKVLANHEKILGALTIVRNQSKDILALLSDQRGAR